MTFPILIIIIESKLYTRLLRKPDSKATSLCVCLCVFIDFVGKYNNTGLEKKERNSRVKSNDDDGGCDDNGVYTMFVYATTER